MATPPEGALAEASRCDLLLVGLGAHFAVDDGSRERGAPRGAASGVRGRAASRPCILA